MSEGGLAEPINPDYRPPSTDISYEVEIVNSKNEWQRVTRHFREEDAAWHVERLVSRGAKARLIQVETTRTQI